MATIVTTYCVVAEGSCGIDLCFALTEWQDSLVSCANVLFQVSKRSELKCKWFTFCDMRWKIDNFNLFPVHIIYTFSAIAFAPLLIHSVSDRSHPSCKRFPTVWIMHLMPFKCIQVRLIQSYNYYQPWLGGWLFEWRLTLFHIYNEWWRPFEPGPAKAWVRIDYVWWKIPIKFSTD